MEPIKQTGDEIANLGSIHITKENAKTMANSKNAPYGEGMRLVPVKGAYPYCRNITMYGTMVCYQGV